MEEDASHTLRLSSAKQLWRRATKGCTPATCTTTTVTSTRVWLCASRSPTIVSVPLTLLLLLPSLPQPVFPFLSSAGQ